MPRGAASESALPPVEIQFPGSSGERRSARFTRAFVVGRDEDCAVRVADRIVSRHHLAIFPEEGRWWVRDLQSSNGTLINGQAIDKLPLASTTTLELGPQGPRLRVIAPTPPPTTEDEPSSLQKISKHYFDAEHAGPAGEHTMLIRQAFRDVKRRQSRAYKVLIGVVLMLLAAVGAVALFQHMQL